ncbi:unnamed protein product, partial [Musa acuminata var. zebrina]
AQVVGWPPVRSYRKNILAVQSEKASKEEGEKPGNTAAFVKVCMDGAPYLRKVDLKMYRSYQELSMALEKMFSSFTSGKCGCSLDTMRRSVQITPVDTSRSCLSGNHNVYERQCPCELQSFAPHMGW